MRNLHKGSRQSLGIRLTLSFLGVIVATAGLVVVMANLITANRFTYMVSDAGQRYARRLAPFLPSTTSRPGGGMGSKH